MKKSNVPTKKEMEKYEKRLEKEGKKFVLTPDDLHNLTDLFYMIGGDTYETIKLNKMDKWLHEFHERIEKITIPELYQKKRNVGGSKR